ncbi:MAG: NTF2 fold immunity protein [Candidatus Kapabacteria bacterium]|nr:NTF2 fold immunity protein [Candidatus Kapabacteria bacterium]
MEVLKHHKIFVLLMIIHLLLLYECTDNSKRYQNKDGSKDTNKLVKLIPKKIDTSTDYVPDDTTALKIAEAVFLVKYGKEIYYEKPFTIKLIDSNIWEIEGTLNFAKGGVAYILIRKKDGMILKLEHGK